MEFLRSLAAQGMMRAPRVESWNADATLAIWGAVIHRQKSVRLISGPKALGVITPDLPQTLIKFHRAISAHIVKSDRIDWPHLSVGVPGMLLAESHTKLEIDWDVTPWVDAELSLQNRERVAACAACLEKKKAFCDWRPPLGALWRLEFDACVEDTLEESDRCTRDNGVVDDLGEPIHAAFYSISFGGSPAACGKISLPRANHDLQLNNMLRRYLRWK